jgi:hypothetical protein
MGRKSAKSNQSASTIRHPLGFFSRRHKTQLQPPSSSLISKRMVPCQAEPKRFSEYTSIGTPLPKTRSGRQLTGNPGVRLPQLWSSAVTRENPSNSWVIPSRPNPPQAPKVRSTARPRSRAPSTPDSRLITPRPCHKCHLTEMVSPTP